MNTEPRSEDVPASESLEGGSVGAVDSDWVESWLAAVGSSTDADGSTCSAVAADANRRHAQQAAAFGNVWLRRLDGIAKVIMFQKSLFLASMN
jgi:hypothetical protein